ncbi:MAG: hypothetical protein L6R38_003802 [Xanthoria sp. 2 TBL-2021]|nr:MAG: hypothetical protein L6R38_003802 [Xanthoria sp. 2 TBL-2021]
MVLHCCNFKVLDVVFMLISNLVRYMVFGNWQMTYQLSSTVLFFSVPFFIVVGQALGIKVTHTINDSWKTMSEAAHGFITTERRPDQPVQSGLGTLSVLPPEIRSKIWQLLFDPNAPKFRPRIYKPQLLGHADPVEDRKQMILSMLQADNRSNLLPDLNLDNLAILRTSKQLHDELLGDLYRNRTLQFCFDNNEHGLLLHRLVGKSTDYYIRLGGFCVARDFANTDFSMFTSIHLDIELPSNECSLEKMKDLRTHLGESSELIQAWQSRKYHKTQRKCPQIDIAIRLHKGTQRYDYEWSESLYWENCIQDIERLLRPLKRIDNVEDVTIKVHFMLRYGQEWLPQVLHEVIHQMKRVGNDSLRDHTHTRLMCHEAYRLTSETLGSEVGGPLSEEPPEKPFTGDIFTDLHHRHSNTGDAIHLSEPSEKSRSVMDALSGIKYFILDWTFMLLLLCLETGPPVFLVCVIMLGLKTCLKFNNGIIPIGELIFLSFLNYSLPQVCLKAERERRRNGLPFWQEMAWDAAIQILIIDLLVRGPKEFSIFWVHVGCYFLWNLILLFVEEELGGRYPNNHGGSNQLSSEDQGVRRSDQNGDSASSDHQERL